MNPSLAIPTSVDNDEALKQQVATLSADLATSRSELALVREMATVGVLGSEVAHDLNNLLTIVIANLDLLAEQPQLSAETSTLVSEALSGALRGAELARGYIALSHRLESKDVEVDRMSDRTSIHTAVIDRFEKRDSKATILAVDDNPEVLAVVVRQLRKLGYRVLQAEDGPAALMMLNNEAVDLLFTDVVMPGGMSGYDLARLVLSRWPRMKALVTSGFPAMVPTGDSLAQGKLRKLIKPYRNSDLIAALRMAFDD